MKHILPDILNELGADLLQFPIFPHHRKELLSWIMWQCMFNVSLLICERFFLFDSVNKKSCIPAQFGRDAAIKKNGLKKRETFFNPSKQSFSLCPHYET